MSTAALIAELGGAGALTFILTNLITGYRQGLTVDQYRTLPPFNDPEPTA